MFLGGVEDIQHATMNKYKTGMVGCISRVILSKGYNLPLVVQATGGRNVDQCVEG